MTESKLIAARAELSKLQAAYAAMATQIESVAAKVEALENELDASYLESMDTPDWAFLLKAGASSARYKALSAALSELGLISGEVNPATNQYMLQVTLGHEAHEDHILAANTALSTVLPHVAPMPSGARVLAILTRALNKYTLSVSADFSRFSIQEAGVYGPVELAGFDTLVGALRYVVMNLSV